MNTFKTFSFIRVTELYNGNQLLSKKLRFSEPDFAFQTEQHTLSEKRLDLQAGKKARNDSHFS
jgi:hypothetical protein